MPDPRGSESGPRREPPALPTIGPVLNRNIKDLHRRRLREEASVSRQDRVADAITNFTGSMPFVYIHLIVFGIWVVANLHWLPGVPAWDESFGILAMAASVEAIFVSTFVLIRQNRMAAAADKRADLDLQISLLIEHEVTKIAALLSDMAKQTGVNSKALAELEEVKRDVAPEAVLDKIEERSH
jgi:uncharacterized membrane protein